MDDRYVILKGERNGKSWIGSADREYKSFFEKDKYGWACEIWIQLNQVDETGFPTKQEFAQLEDFENQLLQEISKETDLYSVGKITWDGKRYLLSYIQNAETASTVLNKIIESKKYTWEFEYKIKKDPEWTQARESFQWEE